jgi:biotin transport system substrate-specific component
MTSVALPRTAVLADLFRGARVRDAAVVLAGAAWVAALGQVSIPLGFTPVPLSLGTFAVLSAGAALGAKRAAASMAVFVLAGLVGAPVFAGGQSGWHSATLGYVFGYIAAATLAGWAAGRGADRSVWRTALVMGAGSIVIYLVGVPWLAVSMHVGLGRAIALGAVPFLVGDAIKAVAAAAIFPSIWALARRVAR